MGNIKRFNISLTKEVAERLEKEAKDRFGDRNGRISMTLEQILREYFHLALPGVKEA